MKRIVRKTALVFLTSFFFATNCVLAYAAHVNFLSKPLPATSQKVVIHIQDIHLNQEAQASIGQMLEALMAKHNVDLIALEGAFEPILLNHIRSFRYPDTIQRAASYLFKKKMIGGALHTFLTTSRPLPPVVGVDDLVAYDANVRAYQESEPFMDDNKGKLKKRQWQLEKKKQEIFNVRLFQFDEMVRLYREGKIDLGTYLASLPHKTKPEITRFLQAHQLEQTLNISLAEAERARVVLSLLKVLSPRQTANLIQKTKSFKSGLMRHADFYLFLKTLCRENNISLTHHESLAGYMGYVQLADSLNAEKLIQEMRTAETEAYRTLTKTGQEKDLVRLSNALGLEQKLVNFSLTPTEWKEYQNKRHSDSFSDFYELATQRDDVMASNLLKSIHKHKAKVTILITGGFHSKGIQAYLEAANIKTVSLTPKITQIETSKGTQYLSAFTQEKTPLEKLVQGKKLFVSPKVWTVMLERALAALAIADREHVVQGNMTQEKEIANALLTKRARAGISWGDARDQSPYSVHVPVTVQDQPRQATFRFTGSGINSIQEPRVLLDFNWEVIGLVFAMMTILVLNPLFDGESLSGIFFLGHLSNGKPRRVPIPSVELDLLDWVRDIDMRPEPLQLVTKTSMDQTSYADLIKEADDVMYDFIAEQVRAYRKIWKVIDRPDRPLSERERDQLEFSYGILDWTLWNFYPFFQSPFFRDRLASSYPRTRAIFRENGFDLAQARWIYELEPILRNLQEGGQIPRNKRESFIESVKGTYILTPQRARWLSRKTSAVLHWNQKQDQIMVIDIAPHQGDPAVLTARVYPFGFPDLLTDQKFIFDWKYNEFRNITEIISLDGDYEISPSLEDLGWNWTQAVNRSLTQFLMITRKEVYETIDKDAHSQEEVRDLKKKQREKKKARSDGNASAPLIAILDQAHTLAARLETDKLPLVLTMLEDRLNSVGLSLNHHTMTQFQEENFYGGASPISGTRYLFSTNHLSDLELVDKPWLHFDGRVERPLVAVVGSQRPEGVELHIETAGLNPEVLGTIYFNPKTRQTQVCQTCESNGISVFQTRWDEALNPIHSSGQSQIMRATLMKKTGLDQLQRGAEFVDRLIESGWLPFHRKRIPGRVADLLIQHATKFNETFSRTRLVEFRSLAEMIAIEEVFPRPRFSPKASDLVKQLREDSLSLEPSQIGFSQKISARHRRKEAMTFDDALYLYLFRILVGRMDFRISLNQLRKRIYGEDTYKAAMADQFFQSTPEYTEAGVRVYALLDGAPFLHETGLRELEDQDQRMKEALEKVHGPLSIYQVILSRHKMLVEQLPAATFSGPKEDVDGTVFTYDRQGRLTQVERGPKRYWVERNLRPHIQKGLAQAKKNERKRERDEAARLFFERHLGAIAKISLILLLSFLLGDFSLDVGWDADLSQLVFVIGSTSNKERTTSREAAVLTLRLLDRVRYLTPKNIIEYTRSTIGHSSEDLVADLWEVWDWLLGKEESDITNEEIRLRDILTRRFSLPRAKRKTLSRKNLMAEVGTDPTAYHARQLILRVSRLHIPSGTLVDPREGLLEAVQHNDLSELPKFREIQKQIEEDERMGAVHVRIAETFERLGREGIVEDFTVGIALLLRDFPEFRTAFKNGQSTPTAQRRSERKPSGIALVELTGILSIIALVLAYFGFLSWLPEWIGWNAEGLSVEAVFPWLNQQTQGTVMFYGVTKMLNGPDPSRSNWFYSWVSELVRWVKSFVFPKRPDNREKLAMALNEIYASLKYQDESPPSIEDLRSGLRSLDGEEQIESARLAGELGVRDPETLELLVSRLFSPDDNVRDAVTYALIQIGPAAIVPLEEAKSEGYNPNLTGLISMILSRISPDQSSRTPRPPLTWFDLLQNWEMKTEAEEGLRNRLSRAKDVPGENARPGILRKIRASMLGDQLNVLEDLFFLLSDLTQDGMLDMDDYLQGILVFLLNGDEEPLDTVSLDFLKNHIQRISSYSPRARRQEGFQRLREILLERGHRSLLGEIRKDPSRMLRLKAPISPEFIQDMKSFLLSDTGLGSQRKHPLFFDVAALSDVGMDFLSEINGWPVLVGMVFFVIWLKTLRNEKTGFIPAPKATNAIRIYRQAA